MKRAKLNLNEARIARSKLHAALKEFVDCYNKNEIPMVEEFLVDEIEEFLNKRDDRKTVDYDCKTPGAVYHFDVSPHAIEVRVDLPYMISMEEPEAIELENDLHDAIEKILAPYFNNDLREFDGVGIMGSQGQMGVPDVRAKTSKKKKKTKKKKKVPGLGAFSYEIYRS
jgi:hypothetical protein